MRSRSAAASSPVPSSTFSGAFSATPLSSFCSRRRRQQVERQVRRRPGQQQADHDGQARHPAFEEGISGPKSQTSTRQDDDADEAQHPAGEQERNACTASGPAAEHDFDPPVRSRPSGVALVAIGSASALSLGASAARHRRAGADDRAGFLGARRRELEIRREGDGADRLVVGIADHPHRTGLLLQGQRRCGPAAA